MSFKNGHRTLVDLALAERAILDHLELPDDFAHRLMQLGFIPGMSVEAAHSAPGGDPRIYRVDGTEVALRRATAAKVVVRSVAAA